MNMEHSSSSTDFAIFLSHSSKDLETVNALVELIRLALPLSPGEIRCTSLDGYRLPAGASIDDQLRQEVHDAITFIGLISYDSVESMYVVFELGARWGSGKNLIPLLAPGVDSSVLKAPLSGLNALRCDKAAHLHQLVNELGRLHGLKLNPAESYQDYVDKIVSLPGANRRITLPKYLEKHLQADYAIRKDKLPNSQQEILSWLEKQSNKRAAVPQKDFEDAFRKRVKSIYWRLEALCLLGFIEKEVTDFLGETPRYVYRLSVEYTDSKSQHNR